MTNPNDPAFPNKYSMGDGPEGLTKREYFAAMALCGFAPSLDPDYVAERAVKYADALIAELSK